MSACEGRRGFSKEKLLKLCPSGGDRLGGEQEGHVCHTGRGPQLPPHPPVHRVTAPARPWHPWGPGDHSLWRRPTATASARGRGTALRQQESPDLEAPARVRLPVTLPGCWGLSSASQPQLRPDPLCGPRHSPPERGGGADPRVAWWLGRIPGARAGRAAGMWVRLCREPTWSPCQGPGLSRVSLHHCGPL